MRKTIIPLTIFLFLSLSSFTNYAPPEENNKKLPTSIGLVIYSNDVETVWNALRLANYSKNQGDTVHIFLLGKGVEVDKLVPGQSLTYRRKCPLLVNISNSHYFRLMFTMNTNFLLTLNTIENAEDFNPHQ